MKKKILNKKLFLNKEKISNLMDIKGGGDLPTGSHWICCATVGAGSAISGCICC